MPCADGILLIELWILPEILGLNILMYECQGPRWIRAGQKRHTGTFDNTLIYYRLGKIREYRCLSFNCHDGYFVSHIPGEFIIPEKISG
jgi:hypothetical protein